MKAIANNRVMSVSADSEDASYPVENLMDMHPKKKFKAAAATVSAVTITVTTVGKCTGLGMAGVTADAATVVINDPNYIGFEAGTAWESGTAWSATIPEMSSTITWVDEGFCVTRKALWIEFNEVELETEIKVTLHQEGNVDTVLAAGVVAAGEVLQAKNPGWGTRFGVHDYSVERELSDGSFYLKPRDKVRTVDGAATGTWDEVEGFIYLARSLGKLPCMWSMIDHYDGVEHIFFGRFKQMPSYSYESALRGLLHLSLIEVL